MNRFCQRDIAASEAILEKEGTVTFLKFKKGKTIGTTTGTTMHKTCVFLKGWKVYILTILFHKMDSVMDIYN